MEALLDKLHAIAVQLGKLVEFALWIRAVIEEERKQDAANKPGTG